MQVGNRSLMISLTNGSSCLMSQQSWNILHCIQALVEAARLLSASHCARMNRAPSARGRMSHVDRIWAAWK
jgi:hypothetical protein